jgi:hypothetical protein
MSLRPLRLPGPCHRAAEFPVLNSSGFQKYVLEWPNTSSHMFLEILQSFSPSSHLLVRGSVERFYSVGGTERSAAKGSTTGCGLRNHAFVGRRENSVFTEHGHLNACVSSSKPDKDSRTVAIFEAMRALCPAGLVNGPVVQLECDEGQALTLLTSTCQTRPILGASVLSLAATALTRLD